ALAVRQTAAPRRPMNGSVLSLAPFLDMSSSGTAGSSTVAYTQFLHRSCWHSTKGKSLGASNIPTLAGYHYVATGRVPPAGLSPASHANSIAAAPLGPGNHESRHCVFVK